MNPSREFRAALFEGPSAAFRVGRFPLPRLLPGEVLVRVTCCTLCGSDFHTWRGRRSSPAPSILGHEVIGVVAEMAAESGEVLDHGGVPVFCGDRITWSVAVSCGECRLCVSNLPQKCDKLFKYGHESFSSGDSPSGGLSEYCVLRRGTAIFPVPHLLPDAVAATANCAAATVVAAFRAVGPVHGSIVLIQGAGMLGLLAAAMARESGATVVLADPDVVRSRNGTAFGASQILDCSRELKEQVDAITGGRGIDVAMEFSGNPAAVESALPLLGIGARYILAGAVFPARPAAVDVETIVRKLVRVAGVHNYAPQDLGTAIGFLARNAGARPFETLIGGSFGLEGINEALTWAERERPPRVAIVPGE